MIFPVVNPNDAAKPDPVVSGSGPCRLGIPWLAQLTSHEPQHLNMINRSMSVVDCAVGYLFRNLSKRVIRQVLQNNPAISRIFLPNMKEVAG